VEHAGSLVPAHTKAIAHRGIALLAFALTAMAAFVFSMPNAQAYAPGSAVAHRPTYSSAEWAYHWHCTYAGWRGGINVNWQCNLKDNIYGSTMGPRSGSFGGGSYGTRDFSTQSGQMAVVTYAQAASVDGGDSDTQ
jgi:hypothetical protein